MTVLIPTVRCANPSAVIPLPEEDDDMGLNDLNRPPADDPPPESFADRVRVIFPKGATSRLARKFEVNSRLAQRWMSGQNPAPQEVHDFVQRQTELLNGVGITGRLQALIEELEDLRLDGEVISSQIAGAYEELVGRDID